jgi:hypothetical protein
MTAYTPTGPWTSGGAPGIDAPFLNALEAWIKLVDNTPPVTLTGTTSGTVTLYQPLQGIYKACLFDFQNYRNSSTTKQNITLPAPFTSKCFAYIGGIHPVAGSGVFFMSGGAGGTAVNFNQYTGASSKSQLTHIPATNIGEVTVGWDTLSIDGSYTGGVFGIILCVGV